MAQVADASRVPTRFENRASVLQHIYNGHGAATRAQIARATNLTSATVSSIVQELAHDEVVQFGPPIKATGGKPACTLAVRDDRVGIGVVLPSPGEFQIAVLTLTGEIVATGISARTGAGLDPTDLAAAAAAAERLTGLRLLGTAIQIPGTVDGLLIHRSARLGITSLDLSDALLAVTTAPVHLVNDTDAEALGAFDPTSPTGSQLTVWVGQGLGSSLIINGRILSGDKNRAGEIGHIKVDFNDETPRCACGGRGCLEQAVSLSSILGQDPTGALDLRPLAPQNRSAGIELRLAQSHALLARVIATICASTDISDVVVAGPAAELGPEYAVALQQACRFVQPFGADPVRVRHAIAADPLHGMGAALLRQELGVSWPRCLPPTDQRVMSPVSVGGVGVLQ